MHILTRDFAYPPAPICSCNHAARQKSKDKSTQIRNRETTHTVHGTRIPKYQPSDREPHTCLVPGVWCLGLLQSYASITTQCACRPYFLLFNSIWVGLLCFLSTQTQSGRLNFLDHPVFDFHLCEGEKMCTENICQLSQISFPFELANLSQTTVLFCNRRHPQLSPSHWSRAHPPPPSPSYGSTNCNFSPLHCIALSSQHLDIGVLPFPDIPDAACFRYPFSLSLEKGGNLKKCRGIIKGALIRRLGVRDYQCIYVPRG